MPTQMEEKRIKRIRRHKRVRARVKGEAKCPRLSIFRSNKHVWIQIIDDVSHKTLVSASDTELRKTAGKKSKSTKTEYAGKAGELIAKKAQDLKISKVVFDRGGYKYHGLVRAIAEGARRGGLKF